MNSKTNLYVMLMLSFVILSGCAKPPAPLPTPAPLQIPGLQIVATQPVGGVQPPVEAATTVPTGDLYRPVDPEECLVIHDAVATALDTRMGITEKSLEEFAYFGVRGGACMIRTKGTGAEFDLVNTLAKIEGAITGWTPADKYRMDTPVSVSRGFTKGNATLVVGISWDPLPEANCPANQPITTCPLTPEQKVFKIVLVAMQK